MQELKPLRHTLHNLKEATTDEDFNAALSSVAARGFLIAALQEHYQEIRELESSIINFEKRVAAQVARQLRYRAVGTQWEKQGRELADSIENLRLEVNYTEN